MSAKMFFLNSELNYYFHKFFSFKFFYGEQNMFFFSLLFLIWGYALDQ